MSTAALDGIIEGRSSGWVSRALCHGLDPELFFPQNQGDTTTPKMLCRLCPVWRPCLERALDDHQKFGTWGGCSERERRRLRARNRQASGEQIVGTLPDFTDGQVAEARQWLSTKTGAIGNTRDSLVAKQMVAVPGEREEGPRQLTLIARQGSGRAPKRAIADRDEAL